VYIFTACKVGGNTDDPLINEAINGLIKETIINVCNLDTINNADEVIHVTISNKLTPINPSELELDAGDFNLDDFLAKSKVIDYNLELLPNLKNLEIHLMDKELITNKAKVPFSENIHFKYNTLYGSNYCKSIIFSNPRIQLLDKTECRIIIKAIKHYEYPIEEIYYLAKIINNEVSYSKLSFSKEKIIFY